jgi:hypothetical protein
VKTWRTCARISYKVIRALRHGATTRRTTAHWQMTIRGIAEPRREEWSIKRPSHRAVGGCGNRELGARVHRDSTNSESLRADGAPAMQAPRAGKSGCR